MFVATYKIEPRESVCFPPRILPKFLEEFIVEEAELLRRK